MRLPLTEYHKNVLQPDWILWIHCITQAEENQLDFFSTCITLSSWELNNVYASVRIIIWTNIAYLWNRQNNRSRTISINLVWFFFHSFLSPVFTASEKYYLLRTKGTWQNPRQNILPDYNWKCFTTNITHWRHDTWLPTSFVNESSLNWSQKHNK